MEAESRCPLVLILFWGCISSFIPIRFIASPCKERCTFASQRTHVKKEESCLAVASLYSTCMYSTTVTFLSFLNVYNVQIHIYNISYPYVLFIYRVCIYFVLYPCCTVRVICVTA